MSSGPGSAPRNVQVRPLSSSTMVIQWDEPEEQNGVVTGYKVPFWFYSGHKRVKEDQMPLIWIVIISNVMWKRREYPLSTWLEKFLECTESNSIWLISNVECTQCINCSQMDFVRFYSWFNWQHPRESEKRGKHVILLDTYQIWAIF